MYGVTNADRDRYRKRTAGFNEIYNSNNPTARVCVLSERSSRPKEQHRCSKWSQLSVPRSHNTNIVEAKVPGEMFDDDKFD
jgi:hypothetical protein